MTLSIRLLVLGFGLIFLIIFFFIVRKNTLKPFYTTLWLFVSLFMFSLVVFEKFYKFIATSLGISDASFMIIVSMIGFLLIYVLYLSEKVSSMSNRIQELISHNSILENKIRKIEKSINSGVKDNL